MSINIYYNVVVSKYAKRHFILSFEKKYKKAWIITFDAIGNMISRIDNLLMSQKAEKIHICNTGYIAKCEFKIAGSNESPKSSGNRIIVYIDEVNLEANILLLYGKTHIIGNKETAWWEREIKQNHKHITKLFPGLI